MDGEFLNIYIDTLIKNVHDLTSKNIVLDTKLQFSDKQITGLQEDNARLSESLERHEDAVQKIQAERDEAVQKMNTLSSDLGRANQELENLKVEKARADLALEESESERVRLNNELQKYLPQPAPKKKLTD
jgi:chromosome segregation ATPase